MTTQHEQSAVIDAQEWLSSLPQETQLKTLSTQILKEQWIAKNPTELSLAFTDCIKQKAWEKVAYMPSVKTKRKVLEYNSAIEWLRDCLGVELDQLMRSIAGYQPNAKDACDAATTLLDLIATEEPSTLKELCEDYKLGGANMIGWQTLLKKLQEIDPTWKKAKNHLDTLITNQNIELDVNDSSDQIGEEINADLANKKEKTYLPKDSRSCLIRTLTKLKKSPLLCKSRNTTTEKVDKALNRLLRGLITVAQAKKEAGLNYVYKANPVFSFRGEPKAIAKQIFRTVGNNSAVLIAIEILKEVK
tara:strand:+ start:792 stop:1700 length:909 start_codon:yes stop_codon:yes gene_type:complete